MKTTKVAMGKGEENMQVRFVLLTRQVGLAIVVHERSGFMRMFCR